MEFLFNYALFLAKTLTLFLMIMAFFAVLLAAKRHKVTPSKMKLISLNEQFEELRERVLGEILDRKAYKAQVKAQKKAEKQKAKQLNERPRLFVLNFDGDVEASAVDGLREHISAIVQVANNNDEVLLRLESAGGYVHSYGLAASQLARLRAKSVRLVIAVDKVAASGGYMMACVGDELLAAPFAIIGSVGVIGALPNFHDLLEKNHVHYEQHTAGQHKRTLTLFGENSEADRSQFQKELQQTHTLFKEHIEAMRPQLDVEAIATGETWYGKQALQKRLVDKIQTSDDYLLAHLDSHQMLLLEEETRESLLQRLKSRFLGKIQGNQPFKSRIL